MRYLGLALYGEGPTDYRFLTNVLRRATEAMCLSHVNSRVEISEVLHLRAPSDSADASLADKIHRSAGNAAGAFGILFIHTDGAGDWETARLERVQPCAELIASDPDLGSVKVVAVIPVREMEAWTLVDGDALRTVFATPLSDQELGIPSRPRDVEAVYDPKQVLKQALEHTLSGRRRSRKTSVESYLHTIGEEVDLAKLRAVPSFRRLEQDLYGVFQALGFTA